MRAFQIGLLLLALLAAGAAVTGVSPAGAANHDEDPLLIVVMDPLCDKLACDCVQGYAQRKYEALSKYLLRTTGKHSKLVFGESLTAALEDTDRQPDFVIGKYSVALHGAKQRGLELQPIAQLTGKDGATTQTGLIVVRTADPALLVDDLAGYHVIFGPEDCDEKNAAARELLKASGVAIPENIDVAGACSEAASQLMEMDSTVKAAAVISSYAQPLLEGCGNIKKGDLRVIGETKPLPFVTAFVRSDLDSSTRQTVLNALLKLEQEAEMLQALETKNGFVPFAMPGEQSQVSVSQGSVSQDSESATKKN